MTATPAATTRLRSAVARWALLALLLGTGGPAHGQQPLPGTAPTVVAVQTRSAEQADASSLVRTRPWWPWLLFGRLHTVVVHFPIGLLGVAGAIEILHVVRRRPVPSEAATYCLVFGIAGAVIAVWFGTLNAGHQSFTGDSALTLERHRLMGWGVIVAAVAALGAGQLARRSVRMQTALVYLTLVVGTTAVVGATGHLGGQLVHGSEYITDVLPWNQRAEPVQARASQTRLLPPAARDAGAAGARPTVAERTSRVEPAPAASASSGARATESRSAPAARRPGPPSPAGSGAPVAASAAGAAALVEAVDAAQPAPAAGGVDFTRDVMPILDKTCVECHGPDKVKARLRMDSVAGLQKGGKSGPLFVAGDVENSLMLRRVLGLDDEDRMPLDKDPLSEAQIDVLRRWIAAGAPFGSGSPE